MKKYSSTIWKKGDVRLIGNQFAKGSKPNKTSFKKGKHYSVKTEFKKGIDLKKEKNPSWKGGKPNCIVCKNEVNDYRTKLCRLISLCRNCHLQTNYNRENWIDYYKSKIVQI